MLIANVGRWDLTVDRATGQSLYQVASFGPYRVLVPEGVARRLHVAGMIEELPAFGAR